MKYILLIMCCQFFANKKLIAQAPELQERLKGKDKVEEIMNIVEQYYKEIQGPKQRVEKEEGEEDGEYEHWARWGLYMASRTDDQGRLVNVDQMIRRAYEGYHPAQRSSEGNWIPRGPTSISGSYGSGIGLGRIDRIAFHPTDANTIYVGSPYGGLFKSTDGGTSWTALTDNIPSVSISGIVVSYADPDDIYILTGDGDASDPGYITGAGYWKASQGVFVSHDGGTNWQPTGHFPVSSEYGGYNLCQNPGNANVLLAGTTDGLFRTDNGGTSWTSVLSGKIYEAKFKPGSSTIAYATGRGKFYKSTDGGETWAQITDFDYLLPSTGRVAMNVSNSFPSYVYLMSGWSPAGGVEDCGNPGDMTFGGVFLSSDSGESFHRRSNSPNIVESCCQGVNSRSQTDYDLAIGVGHNNFLNLVTGGILAWKSTNGGLTWVNVSADQCDAQSSSTGYVHPDIHDIEFNPLNDVLYLGNDGGLMKSTNNGVDWTTLSNGLPSSMIYHLAGTAADIDNMIIGLQDNGCKRRNGNTTIWDHCQGGDGFDCIYNWNSATEGYYGSNSGLYRFWNNGTSNSDESLSPQTDAFPRMTSAINNPALVLYGVDTIFKSTNSGLNWVFKLAKGNWDIERCPSNSSRFYAAGGTSAFATIGTMYRSSDSGDNWTVISDSPGYPSPNIRLTDIGVRPNVSGNVWIVFGGFASHNKVFFSDDAGESWSNLSGTLPNVPVNAIQVDANNNAYIGTDIGVFYRGASMSDWVPFWHRLPVVPVSDLELYEANGIIRASTFGRGVWESDTYDACSASLGLTGNLSGNRYYEVSSSITCTSSIFGGSNTKVIFKSGDFILLNPGFEAKKYNTVHAYIAPCGTADNGD